MHPDLATALAATHGVLRRRDHPALQRAIEAAFGAGELVRLLPGTYATPTVARTVEGKARAACLHDPDAVVTGPAAGFLTGFEVGRPDVVTVASPRKRRPAQGYLFERREVPRRLRRRMDGYRVTSRAMTALDLFGTKGAHEYALRKGVTPQDFAEALSLTRRRRGNRARRQAVRQARDQPWSTVERRAHAHLRRGRVRGWQANRAIFDARGELLGYGDLVFAAYGLVIEIDGPTHRTMDGQRRDRSRDLRLRRAGWEVIRFGVDLIDDDPREFVAIVRDLLASRAGRAGEVTARRHH